MNELSSRIISFKHFQRPIAFVQSDIRTAFDRVVELQKDWQIFSNYAFTLNISKDLNSLTTKDLRQNSN